jgi:hypothetical protein
LPSYPSAYPDRHTVGHRPIREPVAAEQSTDLTELIKQAKAAERRVMGLQKSDIRRFPCGKNVPASKKNERYRERKTAILKSTSRPGVEEQERRVEKHGD